MSFRCPVTGKVSKPGVKPVQVVVSRRDRAYFDTEDGKPGTLQDGSPAPQIGAGWEIERELSVSQEGYEILQAQGVAAQ